MKISIIQPDIFWQDKARNFQRLTGLITPLFNDTDIVILPEMFNTGFSINPQKLSEKPDGETYQWMKSLAAKGNFGICGSYIVSENDKYFNRWVFVSSENDTWIYDKRHLFSMGEEKKFFSPGQSRLSFSFRGVKISAYICYDLRFPVWSRNTERSELIIYAANWPESRSIVWNTLLPARAVENQCYVAGSNRTGIDGAGIKYCGESMVVSPKGEIVAFAGREENCCINVELLLTELSEFRNSFNVLEDSDEFSLGKKV